MVFLFLSQQENMITLYNNYMSSERTCQTADFIVINIMLYIIGFLTKNNFLFTYLLFFINLIYI